LKSKEFSDELTTQIARHLLSFAFVTEAEWQAESAAILAQLLDAPVQCDWCLPTNGSASATLNRAVFAPMEFPNLDPTIELELEARAALRWAIMLFDAIAPLRGDAWSVMNIAPVLALSHPVSAIPTAELATTNGYLEFDLSPCMIARRELGLVYLAHPTSRLSVREKNQYPGCVSMPQQTLDQLFRRLDRRAPNDGWREFSSQRRKTHTELKVGSTSLLAVLGSVHQTVPAAQRWFFQVILDLTMALVRKPSARAE
jgi:hypothetical protein